MRSAVNPLLKKNSRNQIQIKNRVLENFIGHFKHARLVEAFEGNFENILIFLGIEEKDFYQFIHFWNQVAKRNHFASRRIGIQVPDNLFI